jgi:hypothetical protein
MTLSPPPPLPPVKALSYNFIIEIECDNTGIS